MPNFKRTLLCLLLLTGAVGAAEPIRGTMATTRQNQKATVRNTATSWEAVIVSFNLYARSAMVNAKDVGTFTADISRSVDVGTPANPSINVGDTVRVERVNQRYLITDILAKAVSPLNNVFLPYAAQTIDAPEWVPPYPRVVGSMTLEGLWTVVGGAEKYRVYYNTVPSQDGATMFREFAQNSFSVANLGGQGEIIGVNRGFENGDLSNGWHVGIMGSAPQWIDYDSSKPWAAFVTSNTVKHSGGYSAKQSFDYLVHTDPINGPGAWTLYSDYHPIVAGQTYTFSFWYKVESVLGDPTLEVEVTEFTADHVSLKHDGGYWLTPSLTTGGVVDWTQVTANISMTPDAAYVQILAHLHDGRYAAATYYVDDFSMVGTIPNTSEDLLYAIRAVGANGVMSPFSSWQKPIQVQAAMGNTSSVHATFDSNGAVIYSSNFVSGVSGFKISPDGIDGLIVGGGGSSHTHVDNETPSGTINGSNRTFTLTATPNPASSLKLYLNGIRLVAGAGNDYTLSGDTITFAAAPQTGDVLIADYQTS